MKDKKEYFTQGSGRGFIQPGGPGPNNPLYFYDVDTNAFSVSGVTVPNVGGRDPIIVADADNLKGFRNAGETVSAPGFPTFTLEFAEKQGSLARMDFAKGCKVNVYVPRGKCKSLADFDNGWQGVVEIYGRGAVDDTDWGDRTSLESDDMLMTSNSMSAQSIYKVGKIGFTRANDTAITLEIMDGIFGATALCGDCGPTNDGTGWIYLVEKGAVGAPPIVHWSNDRGATWGTSSLTGAANAEAPVAIRRMGSYLVVLSPTAAGATQGGIYVTPINSLTGAPGTWTKISTGFTANRQPRDMVVLGPREAYVSCDGGEILRIGDPLQGAVSKGVVSGSNLTRIAALSDVIIAGGAAGAMVRSSNRGDAFSAPAVSPSGSAITALEVVGSTRFWVGTTTGTVHYSDTAGEGAWRTINIGANAVITSITDIRFATAEVGYIAYMTAAGPRLATTINGGATWSHSDTPANPRLEGVPALIAAARFNRVAVPDVSDDMVAANSVLVVGLSTATDGVALIGVPTLF